VSLPDYTGVVCLLANRPVEILVDVADFDRVARYGWTVRNGRNTFYVIRCEWRSNKQIRLHREILNAKQGQLVDHKNLNGLDNRRSNLRFCSHSENLYNTKIQRNNTSGYKGVIQYRPGRWRATIKVNGKPTHLGCFLSPHEAHEARKAAALHVYGEFAREA